LSVILPTFNGAAYLRRSLDSVAAEADPDIEVVAIDDGSSDDTCAILEDYQAALHLAIARRQVGNWVSNTNRALGLASGEFACFLHQDDHWLPGRLHAVRDQLANTPSVGLVLHACLFVGPDDRVLGAWRCPLPRHRPTAPAVTVERLLVQNFIGIPGAVFRRAAAIDHGGLDESLWYTADWDFWLRLAAAGDTVYVPRPLATFRLHPGSQTATRSAALGEFRRQMETVYERHAGRWVAPNPATRAAVERAARASVEINLALAAMYHGEPVDRRRVWSALRALRLGDWRRLARDSRLRERVSARVRVGFARRQPRA
jgi:glycosyltransferase involved in cell wall biosynthesis